jgi:predicted acyltransferase
VNAAAPRLRSLDVFRGIAVAGMILVNNPGSWRDLYPPLAHAAWHGVTPTDLVFPFFLFAVGNALALVLPRLREAGPAVFWRKVLWRTALIFGIGLLLNAAPFVQWDATGQLAARDWHSLRFMGVLQRIALGFGAAAVIAWYGGRRGALWAGAVLLLGYWAACAAFGDYTLQGWFGTAVDRAVLGASHLYRGEGLPFDPEGLMSTFPAIAQVLLGWWVGEVLRTQLLTAALLRRLAWQALALLAVAGLWQFAMPLNKKIWTSSYVLFTTGLALLLLVGLLALIEPRGKAPAWWGRFFEIFGRNALFVFVLSGLIPRFAALWRWPDDKLPWTSPLPWLYDHVFANIGSDPRLGSLLFALANVAFYGALAWALHRRGVHIRV